jgi:hypothetical protein
VRLFVAFFAAVTTASVFHVSGLVWVEVLASCNFVLSVCCLLAEGFVDMAADWIVLQLSAC